MTPGLCTKQNRHTPAEVAPCEGMILIISILVTLTGMFVITKLLSRMSAKSAQMGVMSEQWLAEQRQSHSQ